MSKAFIRALDSSIKRITEVQELLMRQKKPSPDIVEGIEKLDSVINTLYGLQEEEKEIARFNNAFLEDGYDATDELDEEDYDT